MVVLPCIPKVYLIKISLVKVFPSLILSCTLIGLWSCSDSGEPKIEGCMESTACNYSIENTHDDGSCLYSDCAGECGGDNSSCVCYSTEIQPIFFTANCTGCHGSSGGLTLTSYTSLMESDVVVSGNSVGSQLIKKLKGTAGTQMPKNQNPLDDATIELIETWIDEGALDN